MANDDDTLLIGLVSISDRASTGVYEDKGLPALKDWLSRALRNPVEWHERLIPDEHFPMLFSILPFSKRHAFLFLHLRRLLLA